MTPASRSVPCGETVRYTRSAAVFRSWLRWASGYPFLQPSAFQFSLMHSGPLSQWIRSPPSPRCRAITCSSARLDPCAPARRRRTRMAQRLAITVVDHNKQPHRTQATTELVMHEVHHRPAVIGSGTSAIWFVHQPFFAVLSQTVQGVDKLAHRLRWFHKASTLRRRIESTVQNSLR